MNVRESKSLLSGLPIQSFVIVDCFTTLHLSKKNEWSLFVPLSSPLFWLTKSDLCHHIIYGCKFVFFFFSLCCCPFKDYCSKFSIYINATQYSLNLPLLPVIVNPNHQTLVNTMLTSLQLQNMFTVKYLRWSFQT